MNANPESVNTYNELISLIDTDNMMYLLHLIQCNLLVWIQKDMKELFKY